MTSHTPLVLDGTWLFWTDPEAWLSPTDLDMAEARPIAVPAPWQSQSADLRDYTGIGWYHRQVEIPAEWLNGRAVILHFNAANYFTEVWFNNACVGQNEGGYLRFAFDVSHVIRPGTNSITVRVADLTEHFAEVPHGKQSWYGRLSGLWQSVWLESRAPFHTQSLRLFPERAGGHVRVQARFSTAAPEGATAILTIRDPHDQIAATLETVVRAGATTLDLAVTVPQPLDWSPDTPHLYTAYLSLCQGVTVQDSMSERFGFRTIEARDGRLFLNGRALYLRGALDQDYYPERISTPPSEAFLEDQFRKAKAMGLNCLRCHIKAPDPLYYDVADRVGLLIWTELPNWSHFTERSAQRGRDTLRGILERDGNHPCIIAWTIINEDWGTDLVHDASHRAWLKETYQWLKALDPTRLVVDNSPCWPNFHVQTDLEDYHHYAALPDNRERWDKFVNQFANRADWTFSPHGDAVRTSQEPLIVSEFGNWGLPDVDQLLDADGNEPWWFETGMDWSGGIVYPHGVRQRFQTWGLKHIFGSWRAFVEATQWQQYLALKYEIEAMRQRPEIAGYIITEWSDVHWECNGLVDMNRNPKVFCNALSAINAATVIIPVWQRVAYWSGETIQVEVMVAHGEGPDVQDCTLHYQFDWTADPPLPVLPLTAGQVATVGTLTLTAPTVATPTTRQLVLELRDGDGRILAANHLDFTLYPRPPRTRRAGNRLWTPDPVVADWLTALGYPLAADRASAQAVVTRQLDDELVAYVREGGRLLLLADQPDALGRGFAGVRLQTRQGSNWSGDWASSFSWVRRQNGPFTCLPGGPLIDHSFDGVMPEHVLLGFNALEFNIHVHAGMVLGWIHKPAALIAERRYGRGKAVLSTFRLLAGEPEADPTATMLLDGLIELIGC